MFEASLTALSKSDILAKDLVNSLFILVESCLSNILCHGLTLLLEDSFLVCGLI